MCKLCPTSVYNTHSVNKNWACGLSDPLATPWPRCHQSIQPSYLTDGGSDWDPGRDRHTELWGPGQGPPSSGCRTHFTAPQRLGQLEHPVLLSLTQWGLSLCATLHKALLWREVSPVSFLSGPKAIFFLCPSSPAIASFLCSLQPCFMPSSPPADTAWAPQSFYFSPVGPTTRYAFSFLRLKPWEVCIPQLFSPRGCVDNPFPVAGFLSALANRPFHGISELNTNS